MLAALALTLVTKRDLPWSMPNLNIADIQRWQKSNKRKSLKERHPPCFSVMGGELSAEWEAHIWRPLPCCRFFWSRYAPDGRTTSKDKIHATKSIWGGCSKQCRCSVTLGSLRRQRQQERHKICIFANRTSQICNKNVTNLHIWQWKTIDLHALHVHFSFLDIPQTFSFFLRREMTCFAVLRTTWAHDDKCSILSSYLWSAGSHLIPG